MVRLLVLAGLAVFAAALHRVAVADEPKGGRAAPADPTATLLAKLREPLALKADEIGLHEFAALVEKGTGVGVVINEAAFRDHGMAAAEADGIGVRPVRFPNATAATVLRHTLEKIGATYLVRRDHIEIVPLQHALKVSRQAQLTDEDGNEIPAETIVSAAFREKPLNEALADIAAEFDLTIVLSPQAADQKAAFVSARLLNLPADKAVELIALQADLRVVRRGPAFLVTSRDHADQLFNERLDRERQKIEVENMRNQPNGPGGCFLGRLPGGNLGFAGNPGGVGLAGRGGSGFAGGGEAPAPAEKR